MKLFAGIDGGGTKTECVVLDEYGKVLGVSSAGSSNIVRVGEARAFAALRTCLAATLKETNQRRSSLVSLVAGLAGCGRPAVRRSAQRFLRKLLPEARCWVTTDLAIGLASVRASGPAIVIVAGTGSGALGRGRDGREVRLGGWGPWASDEGSAFDIGRRALAAMARMQDGRERRSVLVNLAEHSFGVKAWSGLLQKITASPLESLPKLFPLVVVAARRGDHHAHQLLLEAGTQLAALGRDIVRVLNLEKEAFPVGLVGGVFGRSPLVAQTTRRVLLQSAPKARVVIPKISPAAAAAGLALTRFAGRR